MTPEEKAAGDRDLLARLRRTLKVFRRDGEFEQRHPEIAKPFVRDIQLRVTGQKPQAKINLAIKQKPKKRKKR